MAVVVNGILAGSQVEGLYIGKSGINALVLVFAAGVGVALQAQVVVQKQVELFEGARAAGGRKAVLEAPREWVAVKLAGAQ